VEDYRSVSHCQIGNGHNVLFWKYFWANGELLCDKFPRLYSFSLVEDILVAAMSSVDSLTSCFALTLSVEAFQEVQEISTLIAAFPIVEDMMD
jgi:hypothetical protein